VALEQRRAAALRVSAARGDDALALLDERWDDLVARQPLPNPLLSASWLRALARWGTGTPLVVVAEAGGDLVAGAAFELRGAGRRLRPITARWLGPFEQLVSPDALADPAWPDAPAALLATVFEHADALRLERTPAYGVAATAFAAALPWRRAIQTGVRWVASAEPPGRARHRRRFAAEVARAEGAGFAVTIRVAEGPDEVAAAVVRMFRVHRDRWRDWLGEEPRFATTHAHRAWNARAIGEMAALGRVRLAEVAVDGRVVASDLGFLHGTGAVAHTGAMRPTDALRGPGHLAWSVSTDALVAAGATAIDLGLGCGGPGSAKARYSPVEEPVCAIVAVGTSARQRWLDAVAGIRGTAAGVARAAWGRA